MTCPHEPKPLAQGRLVLNTIICSLGLNCLALGAAIAGDAAERLRDRFIFCSQFVIEEPAPPVFWDSARDCCRLRPPAARVPFARRERELFMIGKPGSGKRRSANNTAAGVR